MHFYETNNFRKNIRKLAVLSFTPWIFNRSHIMAEWQCKNDSWPPFWNPGMPRGMRLFQEYSWILWFGFNLQDCLSVLWWWKRSVSFLLWGGEFHINIPFVRYWMPSYSLVVRECMLDSTICCTQSCSCSSVRFMWKRSFNPLMVLAPWRKQGSCEPVLRDWEREKVVNGDIFRDKIGRRILNGSEGNLQIKPPTFDRFIDDGQRLYCFKANDLPVVTGRDPTATNLPTTLR